MSSLPLRFQVRCIPPAGATAAPGSTGEGTTLELDWAEHVRESLTSANGGAGKQEQEGLGGKGSKRRPRQLQLISSGLKWPGLPHVKHQYLSRVSKHPSHCGWLAG